ncbi:hypothetical protein OZX74_06740 [Bifidobacterium sp. ESL0798]|uniref:hypothetical protein n=1 Tax=Bifidobacterium sp. ESL0798 TaxID=2983235 RepID=UPI0023FA2A02|nr:hypothetical protein [Bifidobacterium sp. ESL0798]WEV73608.1 hypothetical protein OZX74_06740 [Bifidobacterium sp. ESL0798]
MILEDVKESERLGLEPDARVVYEPQPSNFYRKFDFILTPSMFSDFAFEAYGKGIVDIVVIVFCLLFFVPFCVFALFAHSTLGFWLKVAFIFFAVVCVYFLALLIFPRLRQSTTVDARVQREVDLFDWFDYGGVGLPAISMLRQSGASTRCRFVLLDGGVRLMRMPAGRMVVEDVPWSAFDKVSVTRSCVVLRPKAFGRGKVSFSGPYWSYVSAGGIGCSVLVGLDAVPDVDAFVAECRGRIEGSHSKNARLQETVKGAVQ